MRLLHPKARAGLTDGGWGWGEQREAQSGQRKEVALTLRQHIPRYSSLVPSLPPFFPSILLRKSISRRIAWKTKGHFIEIEKRRI